MNNNNNNGVVLYRLQRANETFQEALLMIQHKHWNTAMNRLYYSCFFAVTASLLKNNIETKTHDSTRVQFLLYFIKTGKIDSRLGKLYNNLFIKREQESYSDLFDFEEEDVLPLITPVKEFITVIEHFLNIPEQQ
jgi:uncharacterized protein (UPF0332 family)